MADYPTFPTGYPMNDDILGTQEHNEVDQDSVEYQLLQLKAYEYAQSDNANNTHLASLHGAPAQNFADYNPHIGDTEADIEALSRIGHVNSASEPTEYAPPSEHSHPSVILSEYGAIVPQNNSNDNEPLAQPALLNSDTDSDGPPMPHMPLAVDTMDVYNPAVNPAAAFWNHPGFPAHPAVSLYQGLPAFDTDPYLPFAPWRASLLSPFHPEPTNRVILAPHRYLHLLGHLYPSAQFVLARYPPSQNPTLRMTGSALLASVRLHNPELLEAGLLDAVHREGWEGEDVMYIVMLRARDWPIGGVALMPNTEDARRFVQVVKGAFDVLPEGQEVFYYRACDVVLKSGADGKRKGMWVCRAYEGRQGPQDDELVKQWLAEGGARGVVGEQEGVDREELVRMGEVMEERAAQRGRRA